MFEKLDECPSCGHPKFVNHLICTDHSISGDSFALVACQKCELVFTNPRPSVENMGVYYESQQYISHSNKSLSIIDVIYKLVRSYTLRQKSKLIRSLSPKGTKLLDYGSGTGHFLKYMSHRGWEVSGVEPNPKARSMAEQQLKSAISPKLKTVKDEYDIITAWHVIEHVHDLTKTIKHLAKRLSKNGYLVIAVPNIMSHDASHYRQNWAAYDVPRHLYHFSQSSFKQLVTSKKLKIKQIFPMKFDAFYVSLLSEKYTTGKPNYLSAIKTAMKSNKMAKQSGEYSSLIYVLKK